MKAIIRVFLDCFKRLRGNIIAIVIMCGLVLMPSLYAWFSLLAFWDPESNTGNLDVAVANMDAGYSSDLLPGRLDAGSEVIDELRANSQLHWIFVDKDEAVEGVKSGAYYAALVIPENFSKDLASVFSATPTEPTIEYYVNEKTNPIAPHLTSIGASTVQRDINEAFAKTVTSVALEAGSDVASFVESDSFGTYAATLERQLRQAADELSANANLATTFSVLLTQTQQLVDAAAKAMGSSGEVAAKVEPLAAETKQGLDATADSLGGLTSMASQGIGDAGKAVEAMKTAVSQAYEGAKGDPAAVEGVLTSLEGDVGQLTSAYETARTALAAADSDSLLLATLDTVIDELGRLSKEITAAKTALEDGSGNAQTEYSQAMQSLDDAATALAAANTNYVQTLKDSTSRLSQSLSSLGASAKSIAEDLTSAQEAAAGAGTAVGDALGQVRSSLDQATSLLNDAASSLTESANKLSRALATGDINEVRTIIGSNPAHLAQILAAPTAVNKIAVYGVANYGSALSPFYTSLALFVGSLFLVIIIKVDLSPERKAALGNPKPHQQYLGMGLFFFVAALAQMALLLTGNLFFLQVQCQNVALYYLCGLVTVIADLAIIYTLVVSFGNVGKAIAMVLLVIQVASSGGELPIQLSAPIFQAIYPWLPFVHSMNGFQGAIAGIYGNQYLVSMCCLLAYVVPSLILGLVLRKPIIRANEWVSKKLEETKLL